MNRFSLTKPRLEFDEGSALVNESNACAVEGTDEVVPNQTRPVADASDEGRPGEETNARRTPWPYARIGETGAVCISLTWYLPPVTVESRVKLGSAGGKY